MLVFYVLCIGLAYGEGRHSCTGHAVLNNYERNQFLQMAVGQRAEVLAEVLAAEGCGMTLMNSLQRLGATVRYSDMRAGYALITISRDKLLETLDIGGLDYAYTRDDNRLYYRDPAAKVSLDQRKAQPVPQMSIPYPRVAATLLTDGPYFAADEIGLTELWKQHSKADGRGVRVAVPDEGFDLLHPALLQARAADGHIVPKVADFETLTLPEEDSGWVRFGDPIHTKKDFAAVGQNWTAPEEGTFRFGIFNSDLMLGEEGNSWTRKLHFSVGILWDEHGGRVWVDTDGDGNFKNQRALRDYAVTHDIDWFGAKQGDDDNRVPFGVKIDAARNAIYIRIGGEHGALVGGALAGNTLTGGLFDGVAPSAELIDSNYDHATYLASIVAMFSRPDVDVINRSGGIGRVGYTGNREGIEDFAQHVLERMIAVYNKPIACFSAAAGTILVNDYAGPEMLRRNRQLGPPYKDTVNSFVWWLPDGLVNTVLAPSANLETDSRYMPQDITWEDGKRHSFTDDRFNPPAPNGYVIGANNSPTIPVVSGLFADLISEARREHLRYNATRLNNAIFTGTHLLDGFPLSQQGYGLINAAHSWNQLSKMAQADDPDNPELASFTLSQVEAGRNVEVDGFHQEISKAGEKLQGELWITRRGGYAESRKYTFSLRGNDGSYELLDHEATLVRDKAKRVLFRTNGASGWHIVFLELRDAKANVVMQDIPLSVRVPDVPERVAPGIDKYESTIQPLRSEYRYIRIGEQVQALRYVMRIPYTGPESMSTREFPGFRYQTRITPLGQPVDAVHHVGPMETLKSLVANDEAHTQEVFWENHGRPEYATQYDGLAPGVPIHATLTVTKYAINLAKRRIQTLSITNKLAEVEGHVELYTARLSSSELDGHGIHAIGEVGRQLPADVAQWRVRISGAAIGVHTDAFLLNCTGKDGCKVAVQREITRKGTTMVVDKPEGGAWRIYTREREQLATMPVYKLREAQLVPIQRPEGGRDTKRDHNEKWDIALPTSAHYAAFRIAGTTGVDADEDGLLIAMTPLEAGAP
jgi:hypothetical protein